MEPVENTGLQSMEKIHLTFGKSHSEVKWTDRKEFTFDELAALLSKPTVGNKNGPCYTPAIFSGTMRRMDQTTRIDIAVLDSDCGHNLIEIETAIRRHSWQAVIHSTHSHMSDDTLIAAAPFEKWQAENPGKNIGDYLGEKKGYLPRVLKGAEIVDERRDGNARNLIVKHAPCPKFRVLIPLDKPWLAENFESQPQANARWRERIGALAHALDLHNDQSCVDTSRLFYLPRIKSEDSAFEFRRVEGICCPLWELPDAPIAASLFTAPTQPAPIPRPALVQASHKNATDTHGIFVDLTSWAAEYASRFEIITAIRSQSTKNLSSRRNGVKQHILCPNAGNHITGGAEGTGTYAVNASDLPQSGLTQISSGFVIHCSHAGCAGLDRLDHLRAMLEAGTLTADDLADPRFLVPQAEVDFSRFIAKVSHASSGSTIQVREAVEEEERKSNIDPSLYNNLPGVMKSMHDYIVATSFKPQPALALASVLTFFGAALGRKAELAIYGTRSNIYALAVAHSGAGKDRLLTAPKDIAHAAGLNADLIGVEEAASDAGMIAAVIKQPTQVMLIDEVSFLIGATHNAKAGVHVVNIISTLLKLYSSSRTVFKGKSYADIQKVITVNQPCVSLLGCSTPSGLYTALSSKDVNSGLLSRCVLFDAGDNDPRGVAPQQMPRPQDVIDWVTAWHKRPLNMNPLAMEGGDQKIDPIIIPLTPEAVSISEEFEDEMHNKKVAARERGTDALYVRARENALKFALVMACSAPVLNDNGILSIDVDALCVTGNIMRWACDLSRATISAMETGVRDEIADTDFQVKMRELRKAIERAGTNGLTHYEVARTNAGKLPERDLKDILRGLIDSGDVFAIKKASQGRGRPREAFVYKKFIEKCDGD
jgi:hypothetical protein